MAEFTSLDTYEVANTQKQLRGWGVRGRLNRKYFLLGFVIKGLLSILLGSFGATIGMLVDIWFFQLIIRRCHDFDKGNGVAMALILLLILASVGLAFVSDSDNFPLSLLMVVFVYGIDISLCCIPGTKGDNRYGPEL